MVQVDRRLKEQGFAARMLLQIHDELVFECPEPEVDRLLTMVRETMEGALALTVSVSVNVSTGRSEADLAGLDLEEVLYDPDVYAFVEWPEMLGKRLPPGHLRVSVDFDPSMGPEGRKVTVESE